MSNGSVIWTDLRRGASSQAMDATHRFERVGLGKAPFRVTGYAAHKFQAMPGAPIQPGTSCCYCGTGCIYVANIEGSDGSKFHVGLDCVEKVGDVGLLAAIKRSPEYRKIQRDKRYAKDEANKVEIERFLADESMAAHAPHFRYRLEWCGMAGRARILKEMRELASPVQL